MNHNKGQVQVCRVIFAGLFARSVSVEYRSSCCAKRVSLPPFHTALAVIFVDSLRRVRCLFWLVTLLDLILTASTPTQGGHDLADVLAGVVLSVLTIMCPLPSRLAGAGHAMQCAHANRAACHLCKPRWLR
ncbi:hypothetical protein GXB81_03925 [Paraburkholderia sp. Ac-20336]|nr:hypothetical protein [Paraburkholderia sp. Ac-20336]